MIGTHNTMTFLKPATWLGYIALPFARCQCKDINRQIDAGARCFDLRVRFDKKGEPYFCHGQLRLKGNVYKTLAKLNQISQFKRPHLYVRLVLEDRRSQDFQAKMFTHFCGKVESEYQQLHFFEGRRKGDWALLYNFKEKPILFQFVGSMATDARWYEKILPFAYALRKNESNKEIAKDIRTTTISIFDFI